MKILLLTQVVPFPPDSGPKVKTHHVLRYLAARHRIHLVSFARSPQEEAAARSLLGLCTSVTTVPLGRSRARDAGYLARSFASGRPFLIERDDSAAMREAIETVLRDHSFDAVHADQLSMAQFAVDLPLPTRVLDEHNAVWTIVQRSAENELAGPRRALEELEWRRLKEYEGEMCRSFDMVTVVSKDDYAALAEAARAIFPAAVIPIAVDTSEMAFAPRDTGARDILSVATMFYPPNAEAVHWFATRVLPLVRGASPSTCFRIVGSRPPEKITCLAGEERGIEVAGYVQDLDPMFRSCALLVVPVLSGSGMRVKILEAFARGIPVVSTTMGVEGIDARPGVHLLVGDTPEEFAAAVLSILRDASLGERLASAARALAESRYDWRTALTGLDWVYPPERERLVVAQSR